jgi:hypothetical protein
MLRRAGEIPSLSNIGNVYYLHTLSTTIKTLQKKISFNPYVMRSCYRRNKALKLEIKFPTFEKLYSNYDL